MSATSGRSRSEYCFTASAGEIAGYGRSTRGRREGLDNEERLGARLVAQDPDVLSDLIDRYAKDVYVVAARVLQGVSSADVEEVVADTFVRAWQSTSNFRPERASLRTWLLMLARYAALDHRRSRLRWALLSNPVREDMAGSPGDGIADADERQRVQAALNALHPMDREIVYRRYYLDEHIDHLAASLGISRHALDNRLWRARRTLRALLSDAVDADRSDKGGHRGA